ncbi:4Fe-4S binding protein [Peribacillus kribbensis]|uniref:4Fe-4S binding protein n=1 Tax=Peribacillus kribbensis TaxID=356658 RepID=UPI00041BFCDE|nr:4Fe-4S binding protein [Peribacillus kribbensis]
MIELISESKCISCGLCVSVCPTNVFEQKKGEVPVISRKDDCQTCFMCEVYCPVDAMYVSPNIEEEVIDENQIVQSGIMGSYRKELGWGKGRSSSAALDASYKMFRLMSKLPGH